jgi:alpha-methylacyl-CoA racemase
VIDAAMSEGAALLGHGLFNLDALGEWQGQCAIDSSAPFYDVYACADGLWLSVCPLEPQFYASFLARLNLTDDPDFQGPQYDTARWPRMKERLIALFASQSRAHWETLFADSDDCVWPVLTMAQATQHPHHRARTAFVELAGVRQPAPAPRLSRTPAQAKSEPPILGEHTEERLRALGLAETEIERLVSLGAVSLVRKP